MRHYLDEYRKYNALNYTPTQITKMTPEAQAWSFNDYTCPRNHADIYTEKPKNLNSEEWENCGELNKLSTSNKR